MIKGYGGANEIICGKSFVQYQIAGWRKRVENEFVGAFTDLH